MRVGEIEVRADYTGTRPRPPSRGGAGHATRTATSLAPQGFWGALQSQGAPNIQGDAYMTYYDTRTSRTNDDYAPERLLPVRHRVPGRRPSGGEVWLFDPGFCHVDSDKGTGEYCTRRVAQRLLLASTR